MTIKIITSRKAITLLNACIVKSTEFKSLVTGTTSDGKSIIGWLSKTSLIISK